MPHLLDGKGFNSDDRNINQPERGPDFHSDQFMDGYVSGFEASAWSCYRIQSTNSYSTKSYIKY
jgi:hypothetical protein